MDSRVRKLVIVAAVAGALLLGLLIGFVAKVGDNLFGGGPNPESVVSSSLSSLSITVEELSEALTVTYDTAKSAGYDLKTATKI